MDVLAALGDAPTAVIAVVAIVLGVVLVARGERGERAAGRGSAGEPGPVRLNVPIAAAEPATGADGLQTMAIGEVGHGAIRLGTPRRRVGPPPAVEASQVAAPEPEGGVVAEGGGVAAFGLESEPEPEAGTASESEPDVAVEPESEPDIAVEPESEPDVAVEPEPQAAATPEPEHVGQSSLPVPDDPPPPSESPTAHEPPPAAPGSVPFRQGTIKLRKPSGH